MKKTADYNEGPEAASKFITAMQQILSVPREEIIRRESEYRKRSLANPRRRGPKPKASIPAPAVSPQS